ncbi:MAG: biopolymer transporter ExbD [Filomicrobium sp.]
MRFSPERRRVVFITLTPLIDIVFIVLIFFLVTSKMRPYTDAEVKLAEAQGKPVAGAIPHMVILHADGRTFVHGVEKSVDRLQVKLANWANEGVKGITVVADQALAAQTLVQTVTMANAAGIARVKILTRQPNPHGR